MLVFSAVPSFLLTTTVNPVESTLWTLQHLLPSSAWPFSSTEETLTALSLSRLTPVLGVPFHCRGQSPCQQPPGAKDSVSSLLWMQLFAILHVPCRPLSTFRSYGTWNELTLWMPRHHGGGGGFASLSIFHMNVCLIKGPLFFWHLSSFCSSRNTSP